MKWSTLDFRKVGWGFVPFVDGTDVRRLVPGWDDVLGLNPLEARVATRALQGWIAPNDDVPVSRPGRSGGGSGWNGSSPPRDGPEVTLPGGSQPSARRDLVRRIGGELGGAAVAVVACGCGSGAGCWAGRVRVSFGYDTVYWTVDDRPDTRFGFSQGQYREAIRHLLVLLEEAPVLIDEVPAP